MDTAHRKVELQSPADLAYLESQIRTLARQKIDRDLPAAAAPEGEDHLRRRVEELVEDYIKSTFTLARQNISINGLDATTTSGASNEKVEQVEYEPIDTRLASRIRTLEAQKEALTFQVADLRRTAPSTASNNFQEQFAKLLEADEAQLEAHEEERKMEAGKGRVELGALQRLEEARKTWERGTDGLVALKGGVGETMAKVRRAEGVVGEVVKK